MKIEQIKEEMLDAAETAANELLNAWFDGEDGGACGFAWVTVYPQHKGNTKAGRAERKELEALGLAKDWTGKRYWMWNPSGLGVQNIDSKEAGAYAAAAVLRKYGYSADGGSRFD